MRTMGRWAAAALCWCALTSGDAAHAAETPLTVRHEIVAVVDPATQRVTVTDRMTVPADGAWDRQFALNAAFKPSSKTPGIGLEPVASGRPGADTGMDRDGDRVEARVSVNIYRVTGITAGRETTVELSYSGVVADPIAAVGQEYARGFSQTPGLIEARGAYLAGSTVWIPEVTGALIVGRLTVDAPKDWKSVAQGQRTESTTRGERRRDTWAFDHPTEEVHLIAGPFTEYARAAGNVTAQAFLRTPDETLATRYLDVTGQYLSMYERMIGPYPYAKFALVENFWETGYGMPSFTLLGEQVIRFPFILHSSYPHELLHNWWGNGVFVDFDSGNWCEGLTAYLADHLVAEQNGIGHLHRRDILLRVTDHVTPANDFPLSKFRSRTDPATEAIGYGKTAMMFEMLRRRVGDLSFVQSLQAFYRDNRFRRATFGDIRTSFERTSKQDLSAFFAQWVDRTGVPDLRLASAESAGSRLTVTIEQTQTGAPFAIDVPLAIHAGGRIVKQTVVFKGDAARVTQSFDLTATAERVEVDPEFSVYRRLSPFEVPTSLSKAFGAEQAIIVLPSGAEADRYAGLVKSWSKSGLTVLRDNEISDLPADRAVWVLGATNRLLPAIAAALKSEQAMIDASGATIDGTKFSATEKSLTIVARHPKTPSSAVVFITATTAAAAEGLARKLPHYGKYSWLSFTGDAPDNEAKGEWTPRNTPMARDLVANPKIAALSPRTALAQLPSPIDEQRLTADVEWLADPAREGRGVGSKGLDASADYIAQRFRDLGLKLLPGAQDHFQPFTARGPGEKPAPLRNVIGVIAGSNPAYAGQSVVVSAHYDHLGLGWPDVRAGAEGQIHPGADDNASGVASILELARLMKDKKPERSVVFVAFSGEESGLQGAKHYVGAARDPRFPFPLGKVMGVLNVDTVGRLEGGKITIFGAETAREWPFVFQGIGFTIKAPIEVVAKDLGSSDQKAFAEAGVPAIQVFASKATDYHRPTDTADKLDVDGLAKVVEVLQEAAAYLTSRPEPMPFTGAGAVAAAPAPAGGPRRVATGLVPDMAFTGKGVRAQSVTSGSGAEKAGLKAGDVVLKMDGQSIDDLRALSEALKTFAPDQTISVDYQRDGQTRSTKMILGAR